MARSNGYPSACVGSDGLLRVVFSQRIQQPNAPAEAVKFARVMYGRLNSNGTWTIVPADNFSGPGHQFQPSIACTGTRATIDLVRPARATWRSAAADAVGVLPVHHRRAADPPAHTIDVRAVQTDAAGGFLPDSSVPGLEIPDRVRQQTRGSSCSCSSTSSTLPLFGGGVVPFLGDYLEVVPTESFSAAALRSTAACTKMTGWQFNTYDERVSAVTRALDR